QPIEDAANPATFRGRIWPRRPVDRGLCRGGAETPAGGRRGARRRRGALAGRRSSGQVLFRGFAAARPAQDPPRRQGNGRDRTRGGAADPRDAYPRVAAGTETQGAAPRPRPPPGGAPITARAPV